MQFLFLFFLLTTSNIFALEQLEDIKKNKITEDSKSVGGDDGDEKSKEDEPETIESFIEDNELEEMDGFMHLWVDKEKDDYFLQLNIADLNNEFIYFTYILDAPQASGNFGGALSDGSILEFRKFKKDIGLYKKNTKFIYDETSNISVEAPNDCVASSDLFSPPPHAVNTKNKVATNKYINLFILIFLIVNT